MHEAHINKVSTFKTQNAYNTNYNPLHTTLFSAYRTLQIYNRRDSSKITIYIITSNTTKLFFKWYGKHSKEKEGETKNAKVRGSKGRRGAIAAHTHIE